MEEKERIGFNRGCGYLQLKDIPSWRKDMYAILKVKDRTSLSLYRTGKREPRLSQVRAIEAAFNKYGVPTNKIWGQ